MSLADLPELDDDAFDALIAAADPLLDEPAADPSAPAAQAMLAGILADDVQPLPVRTWRRRRGPLLVVGAVALASAAAAIGLLVPDVDEPFAVVCHASLDENASLASIDTEGIVTAADAEAACRQVLADGTIGPEAVAASRGPLVVCQEDTGTLGVFPATSCEEVRRAEVQAADPDTGGAPADFSAIRAELSDFQARNTCASAEEVVAHFEDVTSGSVVADWEVEEVGPVDDPTACASITLDAPREMAVLVARPPVTASDAPAPDASALDAAEAQLFDGYWEPTVCVTPGEVEQRVAAIVAGSAYEDFAVVVEPPDAPADACLELVSVDAADGAILFAPIPD